MPLRPNPRRLRGGAADHPELFCGRVQSRAKRFEAVELPVGILFGDVRRCKPLIHFSRAVHPDPVQD